MNSNNPINPTNPLNPKAAYISLGLLILSFAALYYHVILKMGMDWLKDDNYSHGFLIPVISGYLIWQGRERLSKISIRPSNSGLILLASGLIIFLVGQVGAELFTMRFSILVVIWALVVYLAGWEMGLATSIPIAYLAFMIPIPAIIWNKIAFPLKLFATRIAASAIGLLSVPVYREGNILHLANTTLEVADACSGLRSLTSLLAISAAFALITDHSRARKWVLFLSAVPIAILVNVIRLTATAVLASRYGEQVAQGFLHESSGILVFFLAIFFVYLVHLGLQKKGTGL
jgi:exosortase